MAFFARRGARFGGVLREARAFAFGTAFFFLSGLFTARLALTGLAVRRLLERAPCEEVLRTDFRALGLRPALDLERDFFLGLDGFLAMVVLRIELGAKRRARFLDSPEMGAFGKTSNYNMRLMA